MQPSLDVPVLLIIFNRPQTTKKVFEAIRKERPKKLFVAADGPRLDRLGEVEKCAAARKFATAIDWDCELKTFFREKNVGCGRGPAEAISWFFEQLEEGIILEDDCFPSHDFFPFCAELLKRYRNDNRVMQIGGTNFLNDSIDDGYSYYFSNHNMTWGWATWRRAWKLYDFEMNLYKKIRDSGYLKTCFNSYYEVDYFKGIFDRTISNIGALTWWDYQWEFARRINSGLTVVPLKNLVVNLGIGGDATHTTDPKGPGCSLKLEGLNFPLLHPEFVLADDKKDEMFFKKTLTTGVTRMKATVKKVIPNFILHLRHAS